MSDKIQLFRRRFIPNELTWLKDDETVAYNDEKIVTAWHTLNPRPDFAIGSSVYYRKKGVKVSKHYDANGNFVCFYCDIVSETRLNLNNIPPTCNLKNDAEKYILHMNPKKDTAIVYNDLLVDVIVKPGGLITVSDLNELADAYERELITKEMMTTALRTTNEFLCLLYSRIGKYDFTDERFVEI